VEEERREEKSLAIVLRLILFKPLHDVLDGSFLWACAYEKVRDESNEDTLLLIESAREFSYINHTNSLLGFLNRGWTAFRYRGSGCGNFDRNNRFGSRHFFS